MVVFIALITRAASPMVHTVAVQATAIPKATLVPPTPSPIPSSEPVVLGEVLPTATATVVAATQTPIVPTATPSPVPTQATAILTVPQEEASQPAVAADGFIAAPAASASALAASSTNTPDTGDIIPIIVPVEDANSDSGVGDTFIAPAGTVAPAGAAPEGTASPGMTVPPESTSQIDTMPTSTTQPPVLTFNDLTDAMFATPQTTPTYEYANDQARVEITRHEAKNIVYFATEIWLTDISALRSAFSSDRFDGPTEPLSDVALRNDAIFAINGDFATFTDGGIIIRNGDLYRAKQSSRQMLVIDHNGDFVTYQDRVTDPATVADEFLASGVWQTFVFGPVLVENSEAVELPNKYFINTKGALEPRTAIGQLGTLHYLILTVDGRQDDYSQGVSLARLQELFVEHGAITAFNLDGGGSTSLFFDGEIINKPANGGQRHVPDMLYVGR